MEMTIDKTVSELEILKKNTFSYMAANQAFTTAIETMRKYEKIQEIVKEWREVGLDYAMDNIERVINNGNDD